MKDPKLTPKYKVVTQAYLIDHQQTTRGVKMITKSEESVINLHFDPFLAPRALFYSAGTPLSSAPATELT